MPVVSEMVEVQPASCAVLDTVAPVLSKTAECFPDPPAADASPSTPEDDTLVKTAYHLGLPNFKTFLCLRFVLAVWTIFIGAFYAEAAGWAGGALMLAVALGLTVARIVPAAWRYRVAFVAADAVVVGLGAYGFLVAQTLVRSIYLFMGLFVGAQLVIIATVYPSKRYHPFCFPTEKPGRIPAEEYRQQKARVGLAEAELPAWQLRKAPFMAAWMAAFVAFVLMVTHTGQRLMIYPGTMFKVVIPPSIPEGLELTSELVKFKTADNLTLSAYFLKPNLAAAARHTSSHPDLPRLTMWIFYGNTGNMVHQMEHIVPWLQAAYPNLQFFIFSYRGYVDSDGRPHIDGLRHDIDAAVKYLRGRPDVDPDRLVAYGHSIGGALVSDILGRHPGRAEGRHPVEHLPVDDEDGRGVAGRLAEAAGHRALGQRGCLPPGRGQRLPAARAVHDEPAGRADPRRAHGRPVRDRPWQCQGQAGRLPQGRVQGRHPQLLEQRDPLSGGVGRLPPAAVCAGGDGGEAAESHSCPQGRCQGQIKNKRLYIQ